MEALKLTSYFLSIRIQRRCFSLGVSALPRRPWILETPSKVSGHGKRQMAGGQRVEGILFCMVRYSFNMSGLMWVFETLAWQRWWVVSDGFLTAVGIKKGQVFWNHQQEGLENQFRAFGRWRSGVFCFWLDSTFADFSNSVSITFNSHAMPTTYDYRL